LCYTLLYEEQLSCDLELFAEYLIDAGIGLKEGDGADFQHNPRAWGIVWMS
jgi:hypothetical protein